MTSDSRSAKKAARLSASARRGQQKGRAHGFAQLARRRGERQAGEVDAQILAQREAVAEPAQHPSPARPAYEVARRRHRSAHCQRGPAQPGGGRPGGLRSRPDHGADVDAARPAPTSKAAAIQGGASLSMAAFSGRPTGLSGRSQPVAEITRHHRHGHAHAMRHRFGVGVQAPGRQQPARQQAADAHGLQQRRRVDEQVLDGLGRDRPPGRGRRSCA